MFDAISERRGEGAVLKKGALSTALLAHALILVLAVAASLLAYIGPGEDPPAPGTITLRIFAAPRLGDSPDAGGAGGGPEQPAEPPQPAKPAGGEVPEAPSRIADLRPTIETPTAPPAPDAVPAFDPLPVGADPGLAPEPGGSGGAVGPGRGTGEGPGIGSGREPGRQGIPGGAEDGVGLVPFPETDVFSPNDPGVESPLLLVRVEPEYPEIARRARVQGMVVLQAIIGTSGRIDSVRVMRSIPLLDESAVAAVRQWRYRPGRQHGRPVRVFVIVEVDYRLN